MSILKSTNSGLYKELNEGELINRGYHFDEVKAYSIGICQYVSPVSIMFSVFKENRRFFTNSLGVGDETYLIPDMKTLIEIEEYFTSLKKGCSSKIFKELLKHLQKVK